MLDRIDYNMEQTRTHMESSNKELLKASNYQKKARKKACIILLIISVAGMFLVLMATRK